MSSNQFVPTVGYRYSPKPDCVHKTMPSIVIITGIQHNTGCSTRRNTRIEFRAFLESDGDEIYNWDKDSFIRDFWQLNVQRVIVNPITAEALSVVSRCTQCDAALFTEGARFCSVRCEDQNTTERDAHMYSSDERLDLCGSLYGMTPGSCL